MKFIKPAPDPTNAVPNPVVNKITVSEFAPSESMNRPWSPVVIVVLCVIFIDCVVILPPFRFLNVAYNESLGDGGAVVYSRPKMANGRGGRRAEFQPESRRTSLD
jgi:hypothetical protein